MKKHYIFYLFLVIVVLLTTNINAQNIAAFSGTSSPTANAVSNATATPLSRGAGLSASGGGNFESGGWQTGGFNSANNDYVEWSITADSDYIVNITSIVINYGRNPSVGGFFGGGPDDVLLRSSLDGFTTNLFLDTSVSSSGETNTITASLSSGVGGTITFRLYGFNAITGFFGFNSGTFDIRGGLGSVLSVANTGIRMEGSVTFNGLSYSGGSWSPSAPSASTGSTNILVTDGTYTETGMVEVNNLTVNSGASVVVEKTGGLTVNGNLITNNNFTLESDSDEFSSLIVDGTVTGNVSYERYVNSQSNRNDLISAPLSGQTFGDFAAANPNIFSNPSDPSQKLFGPWSKTANQYIIYDTDIPADANIVLGGGTGYRAASTGSGGTFTFTGSVNTGTVSENIVFTGPFEAEWNLVGNPYPSYINVHDFLNHEVDTGVKNLNLFNPPTAAIYGYDGDVANGGWIIYNLATTSASTLIAPGQGFFVSADPTQVAAYDLEFTSVMRSTGTSDDFFPGRNAELIYITLNLSNNTKAFKTDFYFNANASLGFDLGYDAAIYGGTAPEFSIYSHLVQDNSNDAIALQTLNSSDVSNVTIPLGVNANQGEQITFSIAEMNIPASVNVYLEDVLTNTVTLLNTSDYIITPTTALAGTGRFFLRTSEDALSTIDNTLDNLSIIALNTSKELVVSGQLHENTILNLFDIQGRMVLSTTLDNSIKQHRMDVSNLSGGVYIVSINSNGQQKTQKVIIN